MLETVVNLITVTNQANVKIFTLERKSYSEWSHIAPLCLKEPHEIIWGSPLDASHWKPFIVVIKNLLEGLRLLSPERSCEELPGAA